MNNMKRDKNYPATISYLKEKKEKPAAGWI